MKILYLDCFSGLSGDMTIGALLDAGGDFAHLEKELKKLQIDDEYELKVSKVVKNGITSTKFDVVLGKDQGHTYDHREHAHSHEHTYENEDHEHTHDHGNIHIHTHEHDHTHTHNHDHSHNHGHHHRAYRDIVQLIEQAGYSEKVEAMALNMFKKIGEAEGKIHGVPLEDVQFHEVGAVDSIIDIVGSAILIEQLGVDEIRSAPVPTGSGHIHIDHGVYPVPAPATLEILRGVPLAKSELKSELTTPTGAAIAAVLATEYGTFPAMKITSIGYGAGTKSFPNHPNVLRVMIGE